jgi:hypothetical protein
LDMAPRVQLRWSGPSIVAVQLVGEPAGELEHLVLLERLLALPVCAGLRELELEPRFTEHLEFAELLAHSACASSLRRMTVRGAWRVAFADARFERLEQLELAGNELSLDALCVPALRRLAIECRYLPAQLEACFGRLDAPRLEHFEFGAQVYDYWDQHHGPLQQQLAGVLQAPAFARLRSITLRSLQGSLPYYSGFAQLLTKLPARGTLERIDLRGAAFTPEARAELEAARPQLPELLMPMG